MTNNHTTYKELFTFGWHTTKRHFWFLFIVCLGSLILTTIASMIPVIGNVISMLVTIAGLALTLSLVKGHAPVYEQLFAPFKTYKVFLHYVLASIVYCVAVVIGLIALIIPGIYLGARLQFYTFLTVEHPDMGPIEALKKSFELTRGIFWYLFGFSLLFILINILGFLAFFVGLFVTIPVTSIACALLYKNLKEKHVVVHEYHHTA